MQGDDMANDRVEIRSDVVFGTGNGHDLRCDVYVPPGAETRRPAVLLVHGGGWRQGEKEQLRGYGIRLGRSGYVCVLTQYRLVGESAWPAQVQDVKAALRWMRANAEELGLDPDRVALQGHSAGAHIVLFAAGTPNVAEYEGDGGNPGVSTSVDAVIGVYPPTRFYLGPRQHGGVPIEALSDDPTKELAESASPVNVAGPEFPPTMLMHGNADKVVPVSASFLMYETLTKHKVPTELHVFAEAEHGFDADPTFGRRTAELIVLFLERYLKERTQAPASD
ncbi:MAG: alpha/beta hydrolase fold domain-containing protein [Acidimicrobiales bacterium]